MPDISKCCNDNCSINRECYRYTCKADDFQSYSLFTQNTDRTCNYFIENIKTKTSNNLKETLVLITDKDREVLHGKKIERRKTKTYTEDQVQTLLSNQIKECAHSYLVNAVKPTKLVMDVIKATKVIL